jgi:hypothetical protein
MSATSSFVCHGPIIDALLTTDGKSLIVASVLAATLATFTGSANGNGVTTLTPGSATIAFTAGQTLAAGDPLVFSSQPNVTYFVAAAVDSATAATLTTPYTGPAVVAASPATSATNIMSATYTTVAGYTFTSATAQNLPVGFQFLVRAPTPLSPIDTYTLTAAVSTDVMPVSSITPSTPVPPNSTLVTLVTAPLASGGYGGVLTLATVPNSGDEDSANPPVLTVIQKNGSRARMTVEAWGNVAATDHVLVAAAGGAYTLVGADRQPIALIAVPPSSLVD